MKHLLPDLGLILALAAFWIVSGYAMGAAIEHILTTLDINRYPVGVILGAVNLILGMLFFKSVTNDPTGDRMFFGGPKGDEEGDIRVACLWIIPVLLFGYSLIAWSLAIVLRLIDK